jgi:hypothetical protein
MNGENVNCLGMAGSTSVACRYNTGNSCTAGAREEEEEGEKAQK